VTVTVSAPVAVIVPIQIVFVHESVASSPASTCVQPVTFVDETADGTLVAFVNWPAARIARSPTVTHETAGAV
jgi:hypothetical protein